MGEAYLPSVWKLNAINDNPVILTEVRLVLKPSSAWVDEDMAARTSSLGNEKDVESQIAMDFRDFIPIRIER